MPEQNIYSDPAHNLDCRHRFTCGAARCPEVVPSSGPPLCHIDKFRRYQPDNESFWYDRNWEEINRITWKEVLSLQESWIYTLLIIIIIVFIFMMMVLIKVILSLKGYY